MTVWRWKTLIALFFMALAVWFVLPTFVDLPQEKERAAWPWYLRMLPKSRMQLGLDLQGGVHMVLGVDLDRAMLNEADRYVRDLNDYLPKNQIPVKSVARGFDSTKIQLQLKEIEDGEKLERYIQDKFTVLVVVERDRGSGKYSLDLDPERRTDVERQTIDQALGTLRERLDEFGVAEPSIQAQGRDRIVVQLPGLADPQRAKAVLGRTAQLEFKIVDDEDMDKIKLETLVAEGKNLLPPTAKKDDAEALNRVLQDRLPEGTQILYSSESDPTTQETVTTPYLLKSATWLTGDMLEDAQIGMGEYNLPVVNLHFNPRGAEILDKLTSENMNKQLAIVLDDVVQSAPVIRARISDGRPQITFGGLKPQQEVLQEAKDLALVLRSGALPAPVEILQNRAVGPSLGSDSIDAGLKAFLIGALVVVLAMIAYYRMSGLLADMAVIVNVLFTLACLCALNATLTLPGIAGILISVGMAVDANVLIFERIREELKTGKSVKAAIEAGYDRAHITIIDSNVTTIITALVLLQYGSGPIKGFAITLTFGLIANYVTALLYTRLAYDWIVERFNPQRLSI